MPTPEEIKPLLPLALRGLADLLDTTEDRVPAGVQGLLERFGEACYAHGVAAAHGATTVPAPEPLVVGDTVITFPAPPKSPAPRKPLAPEAFNPPTSEATRPTAIPPRRSSRTARGFKAQNPKLPPPPRVPTDFGKDKK
jgi:hypothetical protein